LRNTRTTRALVLVLLAAATRAAAATTVIGWEEADKFVGQEVTVEGRVLGVHCSPTSCLLAFEPTFNRFTAVVQARSFAVFPPDELERFTPAARVRGTVEVREKKPEIVLDTRDALALVEDEPRAGEEAARAAEAQAQAMERMADVLERVEALAERLAAVQERLDALLAQLEQRAAALAAAPAAPAAAAAATGFGEPQPRPAFEALRTIKRGMSRADVERLIGPPLSVEQSGGARGWTTWYYGFGRSITFDGRGRAQSLVGFPAP
jgi:uncharacterized protein with PIN domain